MDSRTLGTASQPQKRVRGRTFNVYVRPMSEAELEQVARMFIDAYKQAQDSAPGKDPVSRQQGQDKGAYV